MPSFKVDDSSALEGHVVAGLCQKILVVNDHFAVAFAGDVSAIQAVVRLVDKLTDENAVLTSKRFSGAVLADQTLSGAEIKLILLTVEEDKVFVSNVYADYGHDNEFFGLWVGDSGAEHAIEHF